MGHLPSTTPAEPAIAQPPPTAPSDWDLWSYVDPSPHARPPPYTLLILNQPIRDSVQFRNLWKRAAHRVAADGGANRILPLFDSLDPPRLDAIVGDLDSATARTRVFFANTPHPPEVVCVRDDESTDFTKAVAHVRGNPEKYGESGARIIAIGGLSGRVDQAFSVMHHIAMLQREQQHRNSLALVGDGNLTVLMPTGRSTVRVRRSAFQDARIGVLERKRAATQNGHISGGEHTSGGEAQLGGGGDDNSHHGGGDGATPISRPPPEHLYVGIMPMRKKAILTTEGLHWDVSSWRTEIGQRLSTSNRVAAGADLVVVDTSAPVLFTVQLYED